MMYYTLTVDGDDDVGIEYQGNEYANLVLHFREYNQSKFINILKYIKVITYTGKEKYKKEMESVIKRAIHDVPESLDYIVSWGGNRYVSITVNYCPDTWAD